MRMPTNWMLAVALAGGMMSAPAQGVAQNLFSVTVEPPVAAPGDDVVFVFRQTNPAGVTANAILLDDFLNAPSMRIGVPVTVVDANITLSCEKPAYPLPRPYRVPHVAPLTFINNTSDNLGSRVIGDCDIRIPATIRETAASGTYSASFGPESGASSAFYYAYQAQAGFEDATSVLEIAIRKGLNPNLTISVESVLEATLVLLSVNRVSASITITDGVPPVIVAPDNISQGTDPGSATALVSFSAVVTDDSMAEIAPVFTIGETVITSPHAFPIGTTTVTINATDPSGAVATPVTFEVTVTDTDPPVIAQPDNIVQASDDGLRTASVVFAASVTDNSGEEIIPTFAIGETVITSPHTFPEGVSTVTVTATDSAGNAAVPISFTITVEAPPNQAPTANAGPDQTVASGADVDLDGSASSDPDAGQTLTYAWTAPAGITLSDATAASPSFTAPTLAAGDADLMLTFSLTVTDSLGLASAADEVTITVTPPAVPESFEITVDVSVTEALPADDTTEATITLALFDADGAQFAVGGNIAIATTTLGILRQNPEGPSIPMRDNNDGTYTAWLRSDKVGIATVSVSVDDVPAGSFRVAFAEHAVPNIVAQTEEQIASFMLGRANQLASNQPRLTRFLRGEGCGSFSASGNDAGGSLNGCASQGNVWTEITASWGNGSSYALGTIGAHQFLSENFLLGGMMQFDRARDDRNNASGAGWMVGPYFAAKLAEQPLYFEGRLLYGQTSNRISPLGIYSDSFSTERWLAQLRAEGELEFDKITWIPSLDFTHTRDRSNAHTDNLGNAIGSQSVALTQLTSGLNFSMPLRSDAGTLELTGGALAIYSSTRGGMADFENGRGRVHMGLNWDTGHGTTVRAGTFYDGIGSRFRSVGGNLRVDIRF